MINKPKYYKFKIVDYGDGPTFEFWHDLPGEYILKVSQ